MNLLLYIVLVVIAAINLYVAIHSTLDAVGVRVKDNMNLIIGSAGFVVFITTSLEIAKMILM